MNSSELKKEGITKEVLNQIDMVSDYSPVQLMPGEDPVNLIRCSSGYWVCLGFGEYLKDEKGRLIVIPEIEARIGRARYKLGFSDQIKDNEIEREVNRLKRDVDSQYEVVINNLKDILQWAYLIERPLGGVLHNALKQNKPEYYERMENSAKKMADEHGDLLGLYRRLEKMKSDADYDSLYIYLLNDGSGLPIIASVKFDDESGMKALANLFSKDVIETTLDDMANKSYLYKVAKFNIEKKHAS